MTQDAAGDEALRPEWHRLHARPLVAGAMRRALLIRNPAFTALRAAITGERALRSGLVSIVVPIYNVAPFLDAALDSLRVQRYPDLEVVMVNDGSTDESPRIAERYAKQDPRFVLVNQQNAGLGAARNAGVARATGEFITFVDSDDLIPVGAIYHLVESLVASGSDFSIGRMEKFWGDKRKPTWWMRRVHRRERRGATLDSWPMIVRDVFMTNKLFRREFFDRVVGGFAEGVLYEDQLPSARAFAGATRFDVLTHSTYFWRMRDTGTSITQSRGDMRQLRDRLSALHGVDEVYRGSGHGDAYRIWLRKTLYDDLMPFIRASLAADGEYRAELVAECRRLWEALPDRERNDWRPMREAAVRAIVAGDFEELRWALASDSRVPR